MENFLKENWFKIIIISALFLIGNFVVLDYVSAHPGNTAADGCHYCRTNCDKWGVPWNVRHCHGGIISQPTSPPNPTPTPTPASIPTTQIPKTDDISDTKNLSAAASQTAITSTAWPYLVGGAALVGGFVWLIIRKKK